MGILYIVSTPIGNLEDISIRAIKTMLTVDYIFCENTSHTGNLLHEYTLAYHAILDIQNTKKPLLERFDDHTEVQKTPEIISLLEKNHTVALVSNAGTPLISDPGYKLVSECRKRNVPVISIPGASALLTALTSSGMPTDSFTFLGFLPEKQGKRIKLLQKLSSCGFSQTFLIYIAPHKLKQTLHDMEKVFGDKVITIARELTKYHEEIWSGPINDAKIRYASPKGEFVLLFHI